MREEAMTAAGAGGVRLGERLGRTARAVTREAAAAFRRTPLEVVQGVAAAIGFSSAVENNAMDDWAHTLVMTGIALPLVYAASALYVRGAIGGAVRWAASAVVVLGAAAYGYLMFDPDRAAQVWRAALLIAASFSALACVPLVRAGAGERREQVQRFIARFFARVVVVGVYAAALFAGLALALAAINGLFELKLTGDAWSHLASVLFILMPPWAVAAGLPALVSPVEPWREEALRLFRRIGVFLLAPLVLIYLAIVYAYTLRVLITGEVPKNLVSPIVIGAGILIVATSLALEPVHRDEHAGGLSFLVRLAAPLLLPLVLFAIWAVTTRVDQYGWTEFRYLRLLALVLLGAFGISAVVRLVRRYRPPLTTVPPVLAGVLLLAAVGPWSAMAVARRDQSGELRRLLETAGKSGPGPIIVVDSKVYQAIVDKCAYLNSDFGWGELREVIPWIGARPADKWIGSEVYGARIGLVERLSAGIVRYVNARLPESLGIPGVAGGTVFVFQSSREGVPVRAVQPTPQTPPKSPKPLPATGPGTAAVVLDTIPGRLLVVAPSGDTLTADLTPMLAAVLDRATAAPGNLVPPGARPVPGRTLAEAGRMLNVELQPGDVVHPLHRGDGGQAGQILLTEFQLEAHPPAVGAAGETKLIVTAARGFVVLGAGGK